jgi:hypothetical protein
MGTVAGNEAACRSEGVAGEGRTSMLSPSAAAKISIGDDAGRAFLIAADGVHRGVISERVMMRQSQFHTGGSTEHHCIFN